MKKRLAAFDLDGTLLTDRKTITEQTREAVRRAIESGIQVAFCTGRTRLECVDVIEALPEVRYLVASSGARIWDLHETAWPRRTASRRRSARRSLTAWYAFMCWRRCLRSIGSPSSRSGEGSMPSTLTMSGRRILSASIRRWTTT